MQKFSKLKPDNHQIKETKDKELFKKGHLTVIEYKDWSIIKESDLVVCMIYFVEENKFIIRYEYIPTYQYVEGSEYHLTTLSGTIEPGETPEKTLVREIEEEAGLILKEGFNIEELKPLFISKGNTSRYHPFIVSLSSTDYEEVVPKGDGSDAEKKSKCVKVDVKYIDNLKTADLITDYMLLKLKEFLNL